MGEPARRFADFLSQAGQAFWQLLPICPTSYGDSPYQTFSSYAGNPYFIDLEELERAGYLKWEEYGTTEWGSTPDRIHYGVLYEKRYPVLRKAAARFGKTRPPITRASVRKMPAGWRIMRFLWRLRTPTAGRPGICGSRSFGTGSLRRSRLSRTAAAGIWNSGKSASICFSPSGKRFAAM